MDETGEKLIVSEGDNNYLVLRSGRWRALHEGIEVRFSHEAENGDWCFTDAWPQIVRIVEPA